MGIVKDVGLFVRPAQDPTGTIVIVVRVDSLSWEVLLLLAAVKLGSITPLLVVAVKGAIELV